MAEEFRSVTSDEDVDEVLKIALRRQGRTDDSLRQRLMTSAEELGIPYDDLIEAEKEYVQQRKEREEFYQFRRRQVREFREHLFAYFVVNGLLVLANLLTSNNVTWAVWPILGWGVGIAFHAWASLNTGSESFQDDFARYRRRLSRRRSDSGSDGAFELRKSRNGIVIGVNVPSRKSATAEEDLD
ncbi:MAG TPA: 2TM domain-containing protein [Fimbriimonadaceae bacterium]|nr:2TM domain-containing protein [Fimbriimonadaceae bacterium]